MPRHSKDCGCSVEKSHVSRSPQRCRTEKSECLKATGEDCRALELEFCAKLCFAQEVVEFEGAYVPRSDQEAPANVTGCVVLRFDKCFEKVCYRVYVKCACGKYNPNEKVTFAGLYLGNAGEVGPLLANLYKPEDCSKAEGIDVDGLLSEGCLSNSDLIAPLLNGNGCSLLPPVRNIAALFAAVRKGHVYVNVLGGDGCTVKPVYDEGLVRGQIFAACTA